MKFKVFILILLFSSVSVFAQSKDEEALKALVKQMTDAQINYQSAALNEILTPDYIEISPVGEFDTREKVLGFYKSEMKPSAAQMSVNLVADEFSIRSYGDFAIVIARLNYKMMSDGKSLPARSIRATIVCRKEKGAWKIASVQYTGIRPPQTPPKSE